MTEEQTVPELPPASLTGERAAKGILWVAIERYGQQGFSFLTFILLSRLLPPEVFGLFAMGLVFTTLVEEVVEMGVGAALVQRADLDPLHLDTALLTNLGLGLLCALGGWGAADWVGLAFAQPGVVPV